MKQGPGSRQMLNQHWSAVLLPFLDAPPASSPFTPILLTPQPCTHSWTCTWSSEIVLPRDGTCCSTPWTRGPGPRLTAPVLISSGPFYFTSLSSIHPSIYPSAQSFHCICWALLWPGQRASGRQKQKSIPGKSLEPQARPPGFKSSPTTSCVIGSAPLLGPQPLSSNTRRKTVPTAWGYCAAEGSSINKSRGK